MGPPFKALAEARHARSLHADGICLRAEVVPVTTEALFADVAERLAGPALVRLSTATWRGGKEWPDILGAAVRLRHSPRITEEATPGDQDLLFSTLRHAWTLAPAFFTTHVHDWLENDYYGLAPFDVRRLGRAKLRLTSPRPAPARQGSRVDRLKQALQEGGARFTFEIALAGAGTSLHLDARGGPGPARGDLPRSGAAALQSLPRWARHHARGLPALLAPLGVQEQPAGPYRALSTRPRA